MEIQFTLKFVIFSLLKFATAKQKVSGTAIKIQDAPYMVHVDYLLFKNKTAGLVYACGGTILNNQYILTAGHCREI